MRVLIIEDEKKIAESIAEILQQQNYITSIALSGEDGFIAANEQKFDLILLDIMLPGRNGFQILDTMRKRNDMTPVLILTARDSVEDRVKGLDLGADDYLIKPFAMKELLARIRSLLRRGSPAGPLKFKIDDLELDIASRRVTRNNKLITLTSKEYELLELLLRKKEQVITREMIAKEVWNDPVRATPLDNVIDVHITRLRKKVDEGAALKLIQTIRGVGFIMSEKTT